MIDNINTGILGNNEGQEALTCLDEDLDRTFSINVCDIDASCVSIAFCTLSRDVDIEIL